MPQLPVQYIHPLDRNTVAANLLLGLITGSPIRTIGGIAGGLGARRLHEAPGTMGAYLRGMTGDNPNISPIVGSAAGNLAGSIFESSKDSKKSRGLIEGMSPADLEDSDTEPSKKPSEPKEKESSMNTVEELFKTATEALEEKVFIPTVLAKLAERGYQAQTYEEATELLKHATVVRQGIASGEMAPVPMAQLNEQGQITKQAAEAVQGDFLAFAPEVEVDLTAMDPVVKEAAEVLAWGFMQSVKEQQAAEGAKK